MRTENDFIGKKSIPAEALYGINTARAVENFPYQADSRKKWYSAIGTVKLACYLTYSDFKNIVLKKSKNQSLNISFIEDNILKTLIETAREISEGKYYENYIVPQVQGGAGTSMNMNVNEIISNVSLKKLGYQAGQHDKIDPFRDANIFQSTNDVIPTSLKTAAMQMLVVLETSINNLRSEIEKKETQNRDKLRIAYTQMQEAVPSSFGKLFSSYNDALSRDWWRVSKCSERIKTVNLGGSAVGTSLAVPTYFVMNVCSKLREITGLPLTSSENLYEATNNTDAFVEVHAILKSLAVNLEKIVSDIRLLASDLCRSKELSIPSRQVGSSIMPGKVNPVIPEFVISSAHTVYANDVLISSLCGQGVLELNAYIPSIGSALLQSIELLTASCDTLKENLFSDLKVDTKTAQKNLFASPAITTALIPYIGYTNASEIAKTMKSENFDIFEANNKLNLISKEKLEQILKPEFLLKAGFSIYDIS